MVPTWAPSPHKRWRRVLVSVVVLQALCLPYTQASERSLQASLPPPDRKSPPPPPQKKDPESPPPPKHSLPPSSLKLSPPPVHLPPPPYDSDQLPKAGPPPPVLPAKPTDVGQAQAGGLLSNPPPMVSAFSANQSPPPAAQKSGTAAAPAPANASATYLISLKMGGLDAIANKQLFDKLASVMSKYLGYPAENCVVLEAANTTSCKNGAPAPAPGNSVVYAPPQPEHHELDHYLKDTKQGAAPKGLVESFNTVPEVPYAGRRLLEWDAVAGVGGEGLAGSKAWGRQLQAASVSAPAPGVCVPVCDVTMALVFTNGSDPVKWNKTLEFFSSGRFLAKMQSAKVDVETVQLVAYQEPGAVAVMDATGATSAAPAPGGPAASTNGSTDSYKEATAPKGASAYPLQFSLEIVGNDAQVTNDTMLGILYGMVTAPSPNPASAFLNPTNTAIIDVRQGPNKEVPVSIGRRLMEGRGHSDVGGWSQPDDDEPGMARQLLQIPSVDPVLNPARDNSGSQFNISQPAVEVTFRLSYVPPLAVIQVKQLVSQLVENNVLLQGFQSKGLSVYQVTLQSFTFEPYAVILPPPAVLAPSTQPSTAPPPAIVIATRQDKGHAMAYIIVAAVVPVTAFAILLGGLAYWWYRRQKRAAMMDEMQGEFNPRQKLKGDAYTHMTSSNGPYSSGDSASGTELVKQVQPRLASQSKLMDMPWSDWKVEPSELTILTKPDGTEWLLGSGASGRVYKAMRNGVQTVAVKMFKEEMTRGAINSLTSPQHAAHFRQEISILKSCHDRNIVQFLGACLKEGQTILVTEFLENGDLYHAINSQQGSRYAWYRMRLPDGKPVPNSGMARRVALDVARGLHFLHSKKIVHFDLKSANILLARDFTAKIADVGLARILHDDVLSTRREVGTFAWAAPEVLLGHRCTEKADIYSFGVLLHELSAGESPSSRQLRRLRVPEECPEEVEELIYRCLDPQPHQRPSARDLVAVLSCLPAVPPFAPPPRLSTDAPPQHRHNRSLSFTSLPPSFSMQRLQQPQR